MEKVTFQTVDQVKIVANYFAPAQTSSRGILCLHMMPETKESWDELAQLLASQDMHVLAIDERGHGESIWRNGEKLDQRTFSDAEQQAKRKDVDAALDWLKAKGINLSQTVVVGASIGANLALDALVRFPELKAAVLLSPGQDYRGVQTDPAISQLQPRQSVLLVASQDDEYSFATIERLDKLTQTPHDTWRLSNAGHGTHMFNTERDLLQKVGTWVSDHLRD